MQDDGSTSRAIGEVEISRHAILAVDAVRLSKARKAIRCYVGAGVAGGDVARSMEWQGTGMDERQLEDFLMSLTDAVRVYLVTNYGLRLEPSPTEVDARP